MLCNISIGQRRMGRLRQAENRRTVNILPKVCGLLIVAIVMSKAASGQERRSFYNDLAFHFDCKGDAYPVHDETVEQFLQSQGFKVLNVVRIQRERNVEQGPSELFVDGIDRERRMVRFMAEPLSPGTYTVGLSTRPPTRHATQLEGALVTFVSDTLRCTVSQIALNENGPEARSYYDEVFMRRESSFKQAQDLRHPPL